MAASGFSSPNVQTVGSPLSMPQNVHLGSPTHTPVVSYVVPSNLEPTRVVSSPNVAAAQAASFPQSPNLAAQSSPQTREISTVYLPPIRYRYDSATGTLVQVGGPSPTNQPQSPPAAPPLNFPQFSPQFQTFSPSVGPTVNPLSQNLHLGQSAQGAFFAPNHENFAPRPGSPPTHAYNFPAQQAYSAPQGQQLQFAAQQLPQQFANAGFAAPPAFFAPGPHPAAPAFVNPHPQAAFQAPPMQANAGPAGGVPTFGHPSSEGAPAGPGQFHNFNNHLYMDTPRARYEAAVKDYYDRMHGNFQNYNPHPESPNRFAQAFSTFEDVASKFFSGTDSFVSDVKNAAFRMFNPNADYVRAAIFKLQRLERVPVNPSSVSKLKFSVAAYFDTNTENYDTHKSEPQWALPTEASGLVDCDFKGETVKIPWKGEEFVFLKILEHVGPNRFVLGRLQLKLDTLVAGHPLKVTIIGDDGQNKGNAILEFAVGSVSLEEFRQMTAESMRTASHRRRFEDRSRNNAMPDYDAMLEERHRFEQGGQGAPQTRLRAKSGRAEREKVGFRAPAPQPRFSGPLRYLVSWCCDITDQDLA